jgi:hypothetical protein
MTAFRDSEADSQIVDITRRLFLFSFVKPKNRFADKCSVFNSRHETGLGTRNFFSLKR